MRPSIQLVFLCFAIALIAFLILAGIVDSTSPSTETKFEVTLPVAISLIIGVIAYLSLYKSRYKIYPNTEQSVKESTVAKAKTEANVLINGYANISSIDEKEPSNHPPLISDIMVSILSLILLGYGIAMLFAWARAGFQFNLIILVILALSIFFPLWMLFDTWFYERKYYYRLGRSAVEAHKTITVKGNINDIFNTCFRVIGARMQVNKNSHMWKWKEPQFIRATVGGLKTTIITEQVENSNVAVHIHSDNPYVTAKWDWGKNRKNIDKIEGFIRAELINTMAKQPLNITAEKFRWVGRYHHSWRLVVKNTSLLEIKECRGRVIALADEVSHRNPGISNWPDGYLSWSEGKETTSIQQGESKELEIAIRTGIDEPILLAYIQGDDFRRNNAIRTNNAFLLLVSITGSGLPPLYAVCIFYPWWSYKNHGLHLIDTTLTQPDLKNYQKPNAKTKDNKT
jgi:hypothetical protein